MAAKTFEFGQRAGQVVQTAYVPQRIWPAIDWWINDGETRGARLPRRILGAPARAAARSITWAKAPGAPGFVELIPATPSMDEMFTRYWQASADWDGKDPIRPFG